MTKMRLFVASLALPALVATVTPAFAQEAEPAVMSPEQDAMVSMLELADIPIPNTPVVAVIESEGAELAEGPGGEHKEGWHHHGGPLSGALAITDDQVERMAAINESYHENVGPAMLKLHTAMHHMMNALGASSIDTAKVKDLQSQIVGLKGDIAKMQGDKLLAMANVFTPEQRHALHIAMLRHHVGMMMGGHHGHGHMMHQHGGPGGHEHCGPEGHEHGGPGGPGGE